MRAALGAADRVLLREAPIIIGVDEVGRGSLAGPVVVSAVAWSSIPENCEVQDSKRMTPKARDRAAAWVREQCHDWTIVEIWPRVIERKGIAEATRLAMKSALGEVVESGAVAVVDALDLGSAPVRVLSEIRADSRYFCVASASIVAKVHRDAIMSRLALRYPGWVWEKNKGYGTLAHRRALSSGGPTFLHRRTFSWRPVLP